MNPPNKHALTRGLTMVVMLLAFFGIGFVWLTKSLVQPSIVSPHSSAVEHSAVAKSEGSQVQILAEAANPLPERVFVIGDEVTTLRRECEQLRRRIAELEQQRPTAKADLAVLLSIPEADLEWKLDHSLLIPSAEALQMAVRAAGAKSLWEALVEEEALRKSAAKWKLKNPRPENPNDALVWHEQQFLPFLRTNVEQLCSRLYAMGMPSALVEPFRQQVVEGA